MKKIIFPSIASLLLVFGSFQAIQAQQTKILTADKHNEYGLVYSLPVTALEITITAEKEVTVAAPFAKYAGKYLGADKAVFRNAEHWRITNVEARPYGAVEPDGKYLMQLKPGALTYIGVAQDGMLLSINAKPRLTPPAEAWRPAASGPRPSGKEYLQYVDEDFIACQSTAKQAQMLSENLMEVRDARLSLTRGTADNMPTDGRQLELMLNSLAEQDAAITAAFTGSAYTETVRRTFTYIPEKDCNEILLRFSDFKGFCAPDDYAGEPVEISVTVTADGTLPVDAKGVEKQIPSDGVRYCIPGAAKIDIRHQGESLYSHETEFAQFGVEFGLNPNLFTDKKEPSYAIFNPVTGGLEEIGVVSEDIQ